MTKTLVDDQVVLHPPHGRLQIQRLQDGALYSVIITGIDSQGAIVDVRRGSVSLAGGQAQKQNHGPPAAKTLQMADDDAARLLDCTLMQDALQALEQSRN